MTEPQNTTSTPSSAYARTTPPAGPAPIRWGGVVWGVLLTAFAAAMLYLLSSSERADQAGTWLASLTPGSAWALAAALLGLIIVVSALLGGIRSSQRRRVRPGA